MNDSFLIFIVKGFHKHNIENISLDVRKGSHKKEYILVVPFLIFL